MITKFKIFENNENVTFESLVGNHILSGVDVIGSSTNDGNSVLFILDDITYEAEEDPSDGYRSYLGNLSIINQKVSNTFYPHEVIVQIKSYIDGTAATILEFIDVETNDPVLQLGTANEDDYYPYCVIHYNPENLALNRVANKYNL